VRWPWFFERACHPRTFLCLPIHFFASCFIPACTQNHKTAAPDATTASAGAAAASAAASGSVLPAASAGPPPLSVPADFAVEQLAEALARCVLTDDATEDTGGGGGGGGWVTNTQLPPPGLGYVSQVNVYFYVC